MSRGTIGAGQKEKSDALIKVAGRGCTVSGRRKDVNVG